MKISPNFFNKINLNLNIAIILFKNDIIAIIIKYTSISRKQKRRNLWKK